MAIRISGTVIVVRRENKNCLLLLLNQPRLSQPKWIDFRCILSLLFRLSNDNNNNNNNNNEI